MARFNSNVLPRGIPVIKDYEDLQKTGLFLEMESFSNSFIKENRCKHDPFHQWSRRWEYPFAYSHIRHHITFNEKFMKPSDEFEILDAGSGFTFFPYYISHKHTNFNVHCCDHDPSLIHLFSDANQKSKRRIDFRICSLTSLDYKDNFFDAIYCISVLEHASNHEGILEQFERVLKPNGALVLTFDVSLEDQDKSVKEVQSLLSLLNSRLKPTDTNLQTFNIGSEIDMLNTRYARDHYQNSLPWAFTGASVLSDLAKLKIPRRPFFLLTVFCGVWTKKVNETV